MSAVPILYKAEDYFPVEGKANVYRDPKTGHTMVCRPGQTPDELIQEMKIEQAREIEVPIVVDLETKFTKLEARLANVEAAVQSLIKVS